MHFQADQPPADYIILLSKSINSLHKNMRQMFAQLSLCVRNSVAASLTLSCLFVGDKLAFIFKTRILFSKMFTCRAASGTKAPPLKCRLLKKFSHAKGKYQHVLIFIPVTANILNKMVSFEADIEENIEAFTNNLKQRY